MAPRLGRLVVSVGSGAALLALANKWTVKTDEHSRCYFSHFRVSADGPKYPYMIRKLLGTPGVQRQNRGPIPLVCGHCDGIEGFFFVPGI